MIGFQVLSSIYIYIYIYIYMCVFLFHTPSLATKCFAFVTRSLLASVILSCGQALDSQLVVDPGPLCM